jgi:hypothetical protein
MIATRHIYQKETNNTACGRPRLKNERIKLVKNLKLTEQ